MPAIASRIIAMGRRFGLLVVFVAAAFLFGRLTTGGAGEHREEAGGTEPSHFAHEEASSGEEEESVLPRLSLDARAMALMDVETSPVVREHIERELRLAGRIDYDETLLHDVAPRAEGEVLRLFQSYRNAPVRRGERLAEVYSPSILAAAEELKLVRASGRSRRMMDMARRKLELLGVSPSEITRIERTGEVRDTYTIVSPADGILTDLSVRQGDWVDRGGVMMRIADLSKVWVVLEAYESDLQWLRRGQALEAGVDAYPGELFEGRVEFIDPVVEDRSRTARVRVTLENPDGRLKPGMFAQAAVRAPMDMGAEVGERGAGDPPLLVAASAPLLTGKRAVVYVRDTERDSPTFEAREILLGPRADDWYIVLGGLEEGELVVSHGAFKIDSELQIRGSPSMMSPPPDAVATEDPAIIRYDAPEGFAADVGKLVDAYFPVAEALAADDPSAAADAVAPIAEALAEAKPAALPAQAAEAWSILEPLIEEALEGMAAVDLSSGDRDQVLDALRVPFNDLSKAVERTLHLFGNGGDFQVFRAYCPMAFDDTGAAWLQPHDTIANPYFGASMLRCGAAEPIGTARAAAAAAAGEEGPRQAAGVVDCH